jgi:hypothetical protein
MSLHVCSIFVRVEVLVQQMAPPASIAGSFPGWHAWDEGGRSRAALRDFIRGHLEICAAPDNLLDPSVIKSPDDSQMFPLDLTSMRDGVATMSAEVPFAFTRQVRQPDLDPDSQFAEKFGNIAGIFSLHWKIGEGEYEEGFQDSENFSATLVERGRRGAGGRS